MLRFNVDGSDSVNFVNIYEVYWRNEHVSLTCTAPLYLITLLERPVSTLSTPKRPELNETEALPVFVVKREATYKNLVCG